VSSSILGEIGSLQVPFVGYEGSMAEWCRRCGSLSQEAILGEIELLEVLFR
jgi:hypothetical protein